MYFEPIIPPNNTLLPPFSLVYLYIILYYTFGYDQVVPLFEDLIVVITPLDFRN